MKALKSLLLHSVWLLVLLGLQSVYFLAFSLVGFNHRIYLNLTLLISLAKVFQGYNFLKLITKLTLKMCMLILALQHLFLSPKASYSVIVKKILGETWHHPGLGFLWIIWLSLNLRSIIFYFFILNESPQQEKVQKQLEKNLCLDGQTGIESCSLLGKEPNSE